MGHHVGAERAGEGIELSQTYAKYHPTVEHLKKKYNNTLLSFFINSFGLKVYKVLYTCPIDQEQLKQIIKSAETRLLFLLMQQEVNSELKGLAIWDDIYAKRFTHGLFDIDEDPSKPILRRLLPALAGTVVSNLGHYGASPCWPEFINICASVQASYGGSGLFVECSSGHEPESAQPAQQISHL